MKIAVPREAKVHEPRVPVVPEGVAKLVQMGAEVGVEASVGATVNASDSSYADAGASVVGAVLQHEEDFLEGAASSQEVGHALPG